MVDIVARSELCLVCGWCERAKIKQIIFVMTRIMHSGLVLSLDLKRVAVFTGVCVAVIYRLKRARVGIDAYAQL